MSRKTEEEEKRNEPLAGAWLWSGTGGLGGPFCLAKALGGVLKTLSNF